MTPPSRTTSALVNAAPGATMNKCRLSYSKLQRTVVGSYVLKGTGGIRQDIAMCDKSRQQLYQRLHPALARDNQLVFRCVQSEKLATVRLDWETSTIVARKVLQCARSITLYMQLLRVIHHGGNNQRNIF